MDKGQFTGPEQTGQLAGVAAVGLDPVGGLHRDQGRRDHLALETELPQAPPQDESGGPSFVAEGEVILGEFVLVHDPAQDLEETVEIRGGFPVELRVAASFQGNGDDN